MVAGAEKLSSPLVVVFSGSHAVPLRVVECVCSDIEIHETRVVRQIRAIPGWNELDWRFVQVSRTTYEPLEIDKIVVDAVEPLEVDLARVRTYLGLGKDGREPREER